jgi:ureidoglycolate lyase
MPTITTEPLTREAFALSQNPFLVIVAPDEGGTPGTPRAFLTRPGQGINIAMNTWHGVLAPLVETSEFLIVDRGGDGNNLEEHHFDVPWTVVAP